MEVWPESEENLDKQWKLWLCKASKKDLLETQFEHPNYINTWYQQIVKLKHNYQFIDKWI